MMNKFAILGLAVLLACGDEFQSSVEIGQLEQNLDVEVDQQYTIGQNSTLANFSRCQENQFSSAVCKLVKPIQLSSDAPGTAAKVRYQISIPSCSGLACGSSTGWGRDWRPTVVSYANLDTANLQSKFTNWIVRVVDPQFDVQNVNILRASIPGVPAIGDRNWEGYVHASWSGCTSVSGSHTQNPVIYPGTYQFCNSMTCTIDSADLFSRHSLGAGHTQQDELQFDANNLGQAVGHCLRMMIGVEGSTSDQKKLELGRVMNTMELSSGELASIGLFANPIGGTWTSLFFNDFQ